MGGAQGERLPHEFGLAVTSGNSLTAALAVEQIKTLFAKLQRPLAGQTVAVLGATGDIGRACALALAAERVGSLIVIARNKAKLIGLRDEIKIRHNFPGDVHTSTDPAVAHQASLIIAATSAAQPLLAETELSPGAMVCDIGYPHTIAHAPKPRPDVLIFAGGLAHAPFTLDITHYTLLPSPSILYGCFAETIALAMAGRYESYSQGQGRITLERMGVILDLARSLGFNPSPLYRGGKPIADESIEAFAHFPEGE
ncbi:MAG: hypothetical protein FJ030_01790 [Chloroflexi bacterium]|nr:hypothetical protein [Chloroflexota bacterium]